MAIFDRRPDRLPTSREINLAIEALRDAGVQESVMRTLDTWNARRLVEASQRVETHEELSNLFVGLRPICRARDAADMARERCAEVAIREGAWS